MKITIQILCVAQWVVFQSMTDSVQTMRLSSVFMVMGLLLVSAILEEKEA